MVRFDKSIHDQARATREPQPFPGWARSRVALENPLEAAFAAGAALASIHPIAMQDEGIGLLWRRRLALRNAAEMVRMQGRKESEADLRDAWVLRRPGDDPGPAGRVLEAWRRLATKASLDGESWQASVADSLAPGRGERLPDLLMSVTEVVGASQGPLAAAGQAAARVMQAMPEAEALAFWFADAALAIRMKWPAPVPLLVPYVKRSELRCAAASPEDGGSWMRVCSLAYARAAADAFDLHAEITRRADMLIAVAPKLRAKEASTLVAALLSEDAHAAGSATDRTTDRSGRRFFDRLQSLGAVRELTGRTTFRLYGL
ncbi:DUF1403 family protein [Sinorhizobium sp. BG8]|uniref:DUF1403 family protein n=1 Tax=Sinorhizobium sp. BG8 TaxID=2613773 RepID=UPI00193D27CF|nr:DUF1403 family protein [Sinorhizobium sp. BG8]